MLLGTRKNWLNIVDNSFICVVIILDLYLMLRISQGIRRHSAQIHAHNQQQQPTINVNRYKKSVRTMYYIIGVFLVCFLPGFVFLLVNRVLKGAGISIGIAAYYVVNSANTLVLLNSALNPFIYCLRIQEICNALLQLLRSQPQWQYVHLFLCKIAKNWVYELYCSNWHTIQMLSI